jgi:oligopeptide/dipeptide ABC transporter ATP-binding protein
MNEATEKNNKIIRVKNLKKYFPIKADLFSKEKRFVYAVDNVSFDIEQGETLGLVGESGCGKSTTGRTILRLLEATDGVVEFKGKDVLKATKGELKELRKKMQIIFQDPYGSLNPRMTLQDTIGEPMKVHKVAPDNEIKDRVIELMQKCGLDKSYQSRYPHEFSGGQRQRIGIARALSLNPDFIVADEPVSALDVSIRSQVLNLLMDLQQDFSLTYMFISHDLSVVKHISDRIGVMYVGSLVELSSKKELYDNPMHPYTQALLSAIPKPHPSFGKNRILLAGDIPNPANPPKGCKFSTRCMYAKEICKQIPPELKEYKPGHFAACYRIGEI